MSKEAVLATAITAITPAWTGSVTTRSAWPGTDPGLWDGAPHQRPGQHHRHRPGQAGHRPDGVGQVGLADDGDGVDADLLAADVVPVGLADGPDGDLADLGAGPDHDDPLAPD